MTEAAYAEWLARGRGHQSAQRPLDALQCYRRAIRESPAAPDAPFHVGELLWQLGRLDEAMQVWRDLAQRQPAFVPPWQALAEAALGRGDRALAREAAARVLAIRRDDARAQAVAAIAAFDEGCERAQATATLRALIASQPSIFETEALGGSLAVALDRAVQDGGGAADDGVDGGTATAPGDAASLLAQLASAWRDAPARLHPLLHALVCEHLAGAAAAQASTWLDAMIGRPLRAQDHDALRRAALAAQRVAATAAGPLRQAYAHLCTAAFTPPVPVLWPRRTAGARARVALLADRTTALRARELERALSRVADVTLALAEDSPSAAPDAFSAAQGSDGVASGSVVLGRLAGAEPLRELAARDVDVLVDLVGLTAPVGPLLAHRPARALVSLGAADVALSPPLVDAQADEEGLIAYLEGLDTAGCARTAGELSSLWQQALVAHRNGDAQAAASAYAAVLQEQPGYAPALHLRAQLAIDAGDVPTGRASLAQALVHAPHYDDARSAALAAAAQARDRDAIAALDAGIAAAAPARVHRAAGHAWLALRDGARAAARFERALALEPTDGETHYNHGVALQMQHHGSDAARAYQRALTCQPDLVSADFNLGVLFQESGKPLAAATAFQAVLQRTPAHVAAHKNLCESLLAAGRYAEWQQAFRRFEARCPDSLSLAVVALEACHLAGDFAGVDRYLEGLRKERFRAADETELVDALEQLLFLLLYFDVEPEMLLRAAETYDHAAARVYGPPLPARAARRPGRIRIGYLSADLRNHVMGKMMYSVLRHRDRERFEVRLYALSAVRDDWTARIEAEADALVSLAHVDDAAAVAQIAADDLDILVDLNTHTRGARPAILARKPARVQITHVASAGTLGLRAIDYKLTDAYADQPASQAWQLETLLPIEGCVYPYRHIEPALGSPYRREALGLAADAVVIGAFVNPIKLSRRCLALWRDVLARVPQARLAISPLDAGMREAYARIVAAGGIDPSRLLFVPAASDEAQNQARYAIVDLVLDTLPYGGVNGTLEALDAGVPVVTLVGARHGERTGYSILANLGVMQTVAHSGREYVEIAVRLARDRAFRDEAKAAIRAGLARSPLVDMAAHTRNLEAAYRHALEAGPRNP
jgi:predicted O-linked N-acetylglucosamine transferase (SPINDLY family)